MEEKSLEILYEHYKDTFDQIKEALQKRFAYTLTCLIIIAVFSLQLTSPDNAKQIAAVVIKNKIGDIHINFNFISNIITFALLWASMLYFQVNTTVERLYKYIHQLEDQLCQKLTSPVITREGKFYFNDMPWLTTLIYWIYVLIFPLIIIGAAILKWINDFKSLKSDVFYFEIDTLFILLICIISFLYLYYRLSGKIKRLCKKVFNREDPKLSPVAVDEASELIAKFTNDQ
ncbi:hypothetical protein ACEN9X_05470 [Mucilaginibacter sp. Mucisp86]|uniref:hypothetical protein n=1 Tax=Mucilaginibacter sp. Mucisp86 TaxID=3243060 RepID=UPI0039B67021